MNVTVSEPTLVRSSNFDADRTGRAFSSLRIFDDRDNTVTIFLTRENASSVLLAIQRESEKILDHLYNGEVSLGQPTEGNTE
jgi:hypothetical protein